MSITTDIVKSNLKSLNTQRRAVQLHQHTFGLAEWFGDDVNIKKTFTSSFGTEVKNLPVLSEEKDALSNFAGLKQKKWYPSESIRWTN